MLTLERLAAGAAWREAVAAARATDRRLTGQALAGDGGELPEHPAEQTPISGHGKAVEGHLDDPGNSQPVVNQPGRRRRPTLVSVARQAAKAGLEVARYEVDADGKITIVTGKPATIGNPWDEVLTNVAN